MSNEIIKTEERQQNAVSTTSPAKLLEIAVNANADIDKLEKLMNLQNIWEMKQAKREFYQALSSFQSQAPSIKKRKTGHNYKYAPLGDIIEQVKTFLHKAGLSYRFEQDHSNGIQVTCCINHVGGHSELTTMSANVDTSGSKNGIQGIGSTVSYLQRYTLTSALGIVTADEDIDGRLPEKQMEVITALQAKELEKAIAKAGSTVDEFCAHPAVNVDELKDFPKHRYVDAINWMKPCTAGLPE